MDGPNYAIRTFWSVDVLQTQFVNDALRKRDIFSTVVLSRSLVVAILIFSSGCSFKYSLFIVLSIVFGKAAVSWWMLINNWSRWLNIAVKFWCLVSSRENRWEEHSGQNVVQVNFKVKKAYVTCLYLLPRSGRYKKFEFLRPFSKATEKTSIARFSRSCLALDQLYIKLKMKSDYLRVMSINMCL